MRRLVTFASAFEYSFIDNLKFIHLCIKYEHRKSKYIILCTKMAFNCFTKIIDALVLNDREKAIIGQNVNTLSKKMKEIVIKKIIDCVTNL